MDTMKKGRISKQEESYIKKNLEAGFEKLAGELNRDPDSVLEFIRRKVVKGDFKNPSWLEAVFRRSPRGNLYRRRRENGCRFSCSLHQRS